MHIHKKIEFHGEIYKLDLFTFTSSHCRLSLYITRKGEKDAFALLSHYKGSFFLTCGRWYSYAGTMKELKALILNEILNNHR